MSRAEIDRLLAGFAWAGDSPTAEEVVAVQNTTGIAVPADLLQVLLDHGGGEGPVGGKARLRLWPLQDWVRLNETLETPVQWPGLVLFGEDGGGGFFGLDSSTASYARIEGIGDRDREAFGATFEEFLTNLLSEQA
jgi:SMI1 / KNR4 family (SUKH-1)